MIPAGKSKSSRLQQQMRTIDRVKKRFMEEDLDVVLDRKPTTRVFGGPYSLDSFCSFLR